MISGAAVDDHPKRVAQYSRHEKIRVTSSLDVKHQTMPLSVICPGVQQPIVDLISLPSLPQLYPNYKPRDERKWLSEVLSHQFPAARILSYQYDFGKPKTEVCWTKILDEGVNLLYGLVHERREENEIDRAISNTVMHVN